MPADKVIRESQMPQNIEEVRRMFEEDEGKKWMTNPVCHGETGFASWDYQLWLENNLIQLQRQLDAVQLVANNCLVKHGTPPAEQWKKYPEEKPKQIGYYVLHIDRPNDMCKFAIYFWMGDRWDYYGGSIIIAFRELPAPYQERSER